MLAEIGQRSPCNLCNSNDAMFNDTVKEHTLMQCRKSAENVDGEMKKNKGWTKPAKHTLITCFCKHQIKSKEDDNDNNNRHDVFADDMELDAKCEDD